MALNQSWKQSRTYWPRHVTIYSSWVEKKVCFVYLLVHLLSHTLPSKREETGWNSGCLSALPLVWSLNWVFLLYLQATCGRTVEIITENTWESHLFREQGHFWTSQVVGKSWATVVPILLRDHTSASGDASWISVHREVTVCILAIRSSFPV